MYLETFFYAIFAAALLLRIRPFLFVPAILLFLAILSFCRSDDWPALSVYANPKVLEFLAGMILAANVSRIKLSSGLAFGLLASGVALLLALSGLGPGLHPLIQSGAPSVMIVAGMIASERYWNWRKLGWLVYLGGPSYTICLFHPLIGPVAPVMLTKFSFSNGVLSALLSFVLAIAIATAIYAFVDRPIMKLFVNLRAAERVTSR